MGRTCANGLGPKTLGPFGRDRTPVVELLLILLMIVLFSALPILLIRLPVSWINLPNKAYWLAPDRRAKTHLALRAWMLDFGIATLVFHLFTFQLVIRANQETPPRLPSAPFWTGLVLYLGFVLVWVVRFYRRFSRPGQHGNPRVD